MTDAVLLDSGPLGMISHPLPAVKLLSGSQDWYPPEWRS